MCPFKCLAFLVPSFLVIAGIEEMDDSEFETADGYQNRVTKIWLMKNTIENFER